MIIEIKTENAAFDCTDDPDACAREVARILRDWADRIEANGMPCERPSAVFDINGNRCGIVHY